MATTDSKPTRQPLTQPELERLLERAETYQRGQLKQQLTASPLSTEDWAELLRIRRTRQAGYMLGIKDVDFLLSVIAKLLLLGGAAL